MGNTVAHSRVSFTSSTFDGDGLLNQSVKLSACSGKLTERCSTLIHRCYHNGAFEIGMVRFMTVPFHPLKAGCGALTFHTSLLQVISGEMSSALCPHVLNTRAPLNTSGFPKKQDTVCQLCHCYQLQYGQDSRPTRVSRSMLTLSQTHASLAVTFQFLFFVVSTLNLC